MVRKFSDGTPVDQVYRRPRFFGLRDVFRGISAKLSQEFNDSKIIDHAGDAGEEREIFLKNFLNSGHIPAKYTVSKGHGKVISKLGQSSLQTDLVLYDGFACPILRDGENHQYFPVESVYATIQVKSRLSKAELLDAAKNIASVKRIAPYETITRSLSSHSGGGFSVGELRAIPFGAVFAFSLDNNSLKSLEENLNEYNATVSPNEWINLVCVLNEGVIYNTFNINSKVLDSRDLIEYKNKGMNFKTNGIPCEEDALLDFYLDLIGGLGMMELQPPPLQDYVELPIATDSGHSYKMDKFTPVWKCPKHGIYETCLTSSWIGHLADFMAQSPKVYKPSIYMAASTDPPSKTADGFDIDRMCPPAYIYTENGQDPLPYLRIQFINKRPTTMYWSLEFDGKLIFLPLFFVKKDDPLFEPCPKCPAGTLPIYFGGLTE